MGIYTIPEISSAGETEESCKETKIDYCVGRANYGNNARGHIIGDTTGMLKLIFARSDRKLLGISVIGESATELIHIGMMVLDNGLTIDEFIEQVFISDAKRSVQICCLRRAGQFSRAQTARRLGLQTRETG
jgi:NAD(P) transhydrogenase